MANNQISIKDPQSAKKWLDEVLRIDEDYRRAMEDAASSLESAGEFMEGTAVDEFINAGTNLLNAAKTTFTAMDKIADTVNQVLNLASQFTETVLGGISSVAKAIFG